MSVRDEYYYTDYPEYFTQEDDPFEPVENNSFDDDLEELDNTCPECESGQLREDGTCSNPDCDAYEEE